MEDKLSDDKKTKKWRPVCLSIIKHCNWHYKKITFTAEVWLL